MRRVALLLVLAGCAPPAGPVALSVEQAAQSAGVPRDLMLAIGAIEGGLHLPRLRALRPDDEVPVAGVLELRHGAFDSLARGAALAGTDEETLRIDTDRATQAGALVLAELGRAAAARPDDLAAWRPAVEELSGLGSAAARADYAARVYAVLAGGGTFTARDGERITISAYPDIRIPSPPAPDSAGTPDFPGAIWLPTDCTNKCTPGRPDGNASVDTIVIHDTEGGWDASVATLQYDAGKSVHYLVDADSSRVGQFRNETDTTWHAGNWQYNLHSVGIEHVGTAANPAGYSDGEYEKSAALVKSIRSRWQVPLDRAHIIGHYQIPNGNLVAESSAACSATLDACETGADWGGADNHRDPGYYWQWCQYMARLGGSCDCNDTYPLWNCTTDHAEAVRCAGGQVEIAQCSGGCVSMPVGSDDQCEQIAGPSPSPSARGESGGPRSLGHDAIPVDAPSDAPSNTPSTNTTAPGAKSSGCSASGAPDSGLLLVLLLLSATVRPARRRAAPACAKSRPPRRAADR